MIAHDHEGITLREGSAELDRFIAAAELERGELAHGANHLAELLAFGPGDPEARALLEAYLARTDVEALIPRGDQLYFATEALRAFVWARKGRLADALELLVAVGRAKPDVRYLDAWALDWLEPTGAIEALPAECTRSLFSFVLTHAPEARQQALPQLRAMERWARLVDRAAPAWPRDGMSVMMRAGILRKAARFDDALALVRGVFDAAPDWHTATALGLIHRAKDDCAAADRAFERALELDRTDLSAMLEAGDMYCDRDRWAEAVRWYERVLAREAEHAWAQPSAIYCRAKLAGDEDFEDLVNLARAGNGRARDLCYRLWGGPPEPTDASANLLRQVVRDKLSGKLTFGLSSLEAPSNYIAFRLEIERRGIPAELDVSVSEVPEPDPRRPMTDVKYVLWTYDGTAARPALPAPPASVARAIGEIAATPGDDDRRWALASRLAAKLGPARTGEALATLVHPPAIADGFTALSWLPRVHDAALSVVAQIDDGAWLASERRAALRSVLYGPQDWITDAAIRMLARLVRAQPALFVDVHEAFQTMEDHRPTTGHWGWIRALYREWSSLPQLFPKEREHLEAELAALDE